jgi:Protein of unknown function (DUF3102)
MRPAPSKRCPALQVVERRLIPVMINSTPSVPVAVAIQRAPDETLEHEARPKRGSRPAAQRRAPANRSTPAAGTKSAEDAATNDQETISEPGELNGEDPVKGSQLANAPTDTPVSNGDQNSADYWITRINAYAAKPVQRFVELGKLFSQAKSKLEHGQWERMFKSGKLRFSLRSAQKLMGIAKNEALAKTTNSPLLPSSLDVLATLARVDAKVLQEAIKECKVSPAMTIVRAKQFILGQDTKDGSTGPTKGFDYERTLESLDKRIRKVFEQVPADKVSTLAKDLAHRVRGLAEILPCSLGRHLSQ